MISPRCKGFVNPNHLVCVFSVYRTHSCICSITQRAAVYRETTENDSEVIPTKLSNLNRGRGVENCPKPW